MKNLYQIALQTVSPIKLKKNGEAGHVGCALETVGGVVFTGICIDVPCSIGICAEQAAIAEMLKNRETKIKSIRRWKHFASLWKMQRIDVTIRPL